MVSSSSVPGAAKARALDSARTDAECSERSICCSGSSSARSANSGADSCGWRVPRWRSSFSRSSFWRPSFWRSVTSIISTVGSGTRKSRFQLTDVDAFRWGAGSAGPSGTKGKRSSCSGEISSLLAGFAKMGSSSGKTAATGVTDSASAPEEPASASAGSPRSTRG